jgi:hypothetical protein
MENNNFKLGKLQPKIDERTFQLRTLLVDKNLPILPKEFNVDSLCILPIHTYMYANDRYGDCVIAGRAHMTLRFECLEENKVINITDADVISAYFYESNGNDSGLVMLDSLNHWREEGWFAANNPYNIYAFAQVNPSHISDIQYSIYLLRGVYVGLALPNSAKNQTVWDVTSGPDSNNGSWGGHCVYVNAYNEVGPICVTWGRKQQMSWAFFVRYSDEVYAVIDNKNTWVNPATNPINCELLYQYIKEVCDSPPTPPNFNPPKPPTPNPVPKPWYDGIAKFFNDLWKAIQGWFVGR